MTTDLLSKYKQRLEFLDLAAGTKYRYLRVASMYLHHSKGVLSRDAVESFVIQHKESSSTYRRFLMVVLKGLFGVAREEWPFSPREMPKLSTPSRPFFTVEDIHKLLAVAKDSPVDYALIWTAAIVGCRREELARMTLGDYNAPQLVVKTAKGGHERVRTLSLEAVEALNRYLKVRHSKHQALFVSEQGVPLSTTVMGNRLRKLVKEAGLKPGSSWHAVRRGTVTRLYQSGLGVVELQNLLGWRSSVMPSLYIQLVSSEVDARARELDPLDKRP